MLRAILKLVAVGGVVALCGTADSTELYAAGGGALLAMPFAVALIDRRTEPPKRVTVDVVPLPAPDDVEGVTVRAPMTSEEAYEMHARYATNFDQQAAIARYEAQHGLEFDPAPSAGEFDQGAYATALQYADAFEAQLNRQRRTSAYQIAPPRRTARGSVAPQTYRAVDIRPRPVATTPSDWEERTLVGVHPLKRFK